MRPLVARIVRGQRLFLALVASHLIFKGLLWPTVARAPLSGDERAYRDGALALRNLIYDFATLTSPDMAEIKANVFSNGWFMPGTSLVLTPLYVVFPDAGVEVVRTYMGVLSSVLLLTLAWWLRRRLGQAYACGLMVVPGLVPMWVVFSYTMWGDLLAGLIAVAIVIVIHKLIQALGGDGRLRVRDGALLGLLLAVCLYLRSSALPLVAGTLMLLGVVALIVGRGAELRRAIAVGLAAVAVFIALLAPWSLSASKVFDTRVTTTTTMSMSLGITFGHREDLCFGPCPTGGPNEPVALWEDVVRYAREVAAATGQSEVDVQRDMAAYALRDVTPRSYATTVIANLERYLLLPTAFAERYFDEGHALRRPVETMTNAMLALAGIAMTLLMLDVRRVEFEDRILRMVLKLFMLANLVQPLVHPGHGRYWTMFAPLLGLAGAFLLRRLRMKRPRHRTDGRIPRLPAATVAALDVAATLFLIVAATVLLVLGT